MPEIKPNPPMLKQRQQMFAVGFVVWLFLLVWSGSAFWAHLESSQDPQYISGSKIGALAGEFIILAFIWYHCFHRKMNVRRWALIFAGVMSIVVVVHSGAVRGLRAAKAEQIEAEARMAENAKKLVAAQVESAGRAAGNARAAGASRSDARRLGASIAEKAGDGAVKQLREMTEAGQAKVQRATILPEWYIRDWMYTGIFVIGLFLLSCLFWQMSGHEDQIDADFDGRPDHLQQPPPPPPPAIAEWPTDIPVEGRRPNE